MSERKERKKDENKRQRKKIKENKTGLQPVSRPVEQPLLGFKTVERENGFYFCIMFFSYF